MPKARSGYHKKRKFHGNQHSKPKRTCLGAGDEYRSSENNTGTSVSARKIPLPKQSDSLQSGKSSADLASMVFV